MADIKETREALVGVLELSLYLTTRFKDGIDFGDAVDIWNKLSADDDFTAKLKAAYDGYDGIKAETKDLDASEITELIIVSATYIPKFIEQTKKAA